jgi:prephenate dehydratase
MLGANSDLACRAACPDYETLPCETFEDAFRAVQEGEAARAMIPVDNTLAGRVADVHHLLPHSGLKIIGEHFEPIRHALLAIKGASIESIQHVHSHVHAIPQCRKLIRELGVKAHVQADTAGAAKYVSEKADPVHAAIATPLAAEIYGLEILKSDIQDADHNTTRFLVLSQDENTPAYNDNDQFITSLIFRVRNIPAALYKALGGFATNGVNMLKLESYVDPNFQVAQFYADVSGHVQEQALKLALEELGFFASELNVLGTYKAHAFRQTLN